MQITIKPAGMLKDSIPSGRVVTDSHTVGDVLAQYPLPEDMGLVMMVNRRLASWQTELHEGDILFVSPVIGGGAKHLL